MLWDYWHNVCDRTCRREGRTASNNKRIRSDGKDDGFVASCYEAIHHQAKVVVLDSGFCVLKGLIELRKLGVFAASVVKKRRYWPRYVDGEGIKALFGTKDIGDVDALGGTLDGVPFHLFCMKEPDYVMTMMSTYGTNTRQQKITHRSFQQQGQQRKVSFSYPEVIGNHFMYRHMVDDHNS